MKKKMTITEEAMEHVTGGANEYGGAIYVNNGEIPNIPVTFNGGSLPEGTPQGGAIYSEGSVAMGEVQFTPPKEPPLYGGVINVSR